MSHQVAQRLPIFPLFSLPRESPITRRAPLLVSVVSAWELALLDAKGRIGLAVPVGDWIEQALDRPGFSLVGLSVPVAVDSCRLPGQFHADPGDRFLVATARAKNAVLVTRDAKIIDYGRAGHMRVMAV